MTDEQAPPVNADTGATVLGQPPAQGETWTPPDWAKDVPQEHHALLKAKNYKTPADVVNAYASAQKLISADKIPLPGKDGVWDAESAKKLGIPEKPDGYQYKKPELPQGMKWDETFEKAALPVAHSLGLTPKQLEGLMTFYAAHQAEQFKGMGVQMQQGRTEAEAALRQEFGPQYDARMTQALRVVQSLGGPEVQAVLNETGAGNRPELVKFFAKIGAMMGEDQLKSGASGGFGMGREEAKAEITKLLQHPARMDRNHPEHRYYLERMAELQKIATPEAA